jgi:hypothetical protein
MIYRMFIDECGTHSLSKFEDINSQYLSLTGIIIELDYARSKFTTNLEALKERHFGHAPTRPIILHRKELVNRIAPFDSLVDPVKEAAFNADFLQLVAMEPYVVLTVTIDKQEHVDRYKIWRMDPYHYCIEILMERYMLWLRRRGHRGDIMIEIRNKTLDKKLKKLYAHFYKHGNNYNDSAAFQQTLTSKEIKFGAKTDNISGLQFADLVAHPCRAAAIARRRSQDLPATFGGQVAALLEASKYDKPVNRYGRKWLP